MLRLKLSGTNSGFLTFRVSIGVFGNAQGQVWFASRKRLGVIYHRRAWPTGQGLD
jgi:hypothetical protein